MKTEIKDLYRKDPKLAKEVAKVLGFKIETKAKKKSKADSVIKLGQALIDNKTKNFILLNKTALVSFTKELFKLFPAFEGANSGQLEFKKSMNSMDYENLKKDGYKPQSNISFALKFKR